MTASESLVHLDYPVARIVSAIQYEQKFYIRMVNAYVQALFNFVLAASPGTDQWQHPEAERMVMSDLLLSQERLLQH